MKRMKVNFSGGNVLRLSAAGVDVDSAAPHELLLNESVLTGQVVQTGLIVNPKTGVEWFGSAAIFDQGYIPACVFWPVFGVELISPSQWMYGSFAAPNLEIDIEVTQTQIEAEFYHSFVDGLGYIVLRQPR